MVFTIHNLEFGQSYIGEAAYYCQRFTTVSPTYAMEVLSSIEHAVQTLLTQLLRSVTCCHVSPGNPEVLEAHQHMQRPLSMVLDTVGVEGSDDLTQPESAAPTC